MELELFDFIDKTIKEYQLHIPSYDYAEGQLKQVFERMAMENDHETVSIYSRVKSPESLREKLLRNKFYVHFKNPKDALEHLSDTIGITIECRFIRNEAEIHRSLFHHFKSLPNGYSQCIYNEDVYLNLRSVQPQVQRNGFTIYRIDGYYMFHDEKINYELQIKALVHRFWSEIEHEIVYKNPEFVAYDRFIKNMLGSVRDSLEVVDRQLEIMYNELRNESSRVQIGMDDTGFKIMCASSINDLVNIKMQESVGFRSDFKKCSAILAQYIYIRYFINGEDNKTRMLDFLEHLNYLAANSIDFHTELYLEKEFSSDDLFIKTVGEYWVSRMNTDFEWHIFFVMLFAIQPGSNLEDFNDFAQVIKMLLIQPSWYQSKFAKFTKENAMLARDIFMRALAEGLVEADTIEMIHEDKLLEISALFKEFVENAEADYDSYASMAKRVDDLCAMLKHQIVHLFH